MSPSAEPVPDRRHHSLQPIAFTVAALTVAAGAQIQVRSRPAASLAAFAVAAVLIVIARRALPHAAESETPSDAALWPPAGFWIWFGAATLACAAAGLAVRWQLHARVSHLIWLAGLLLYGAAAWRARATDRAGASGGASASTELFAAAAAVLFAAVVFGWHLTSIPPEVHGDDAEVGLDAIGLIERFNLFETGWFWLPRFHALPTALGLKLFGVNLLGLRFPSWALGVASVALLFAIARRLWDLEFALIASVLLASQRYFIHLSRAGYHYVDTPFFSLLILWLLLRAWIEQRFAAAVLCGIALGFAVQTYYASRLLPVLVVLTCVGWLLAERCRKLAARAALLAVITVAALGTIAPIAAHFASQPADLWRRTTDTSVFGTEARTHLSYGYGTNDLGRILLIQAGAAFSLFNATGDNSLQYGYRQPLFEPMSAALFVLGAALALAGARRKRNQVVLLWTTVPLIAGAVLTIDTPFYPRISGLVPFAVLAVALALRHTLEAMRAAVAGARGRRLAQAIAVATVGVAIAVNLRSYFVDYAPHHRHSPAVEISAWVRQHGAGKTAYMVGGVPRLYVRHGAIRFLTWGYQMRDVADLDAELQARPFDPQTSIFVVLPLGESALGKLTAALGEVDVETVRDSRGAVVFTGVIPKAAKQSAAPSRRRMALSEEVGPRRICPNDAV